MKKRLKISLPYVSNSCKRSDQEKGANCVVKIESGACWGISFPKFLYVVSWAPTAVETHSRFAGESSGSSAHEGKGWREQPARLTVRNVDCRVTRQRTLKKHLGSDYASLQLLMS